MNAFASLYDLYSSQPWIAFPICLTVALAAGLLLALVYRFVKKGYSYVKFTPLAIAILPVAMALVVGLLNVYNQSLESSDAVRVGVVLTAGIALTRFRSDKLAIEDMIYLVLASALGVVYGIGYVLYASLSALAIVVVLIVLHLCHFGETMGGVLSVRLKVPEELNDSAVFDAVFSRMCQSHHLGEVRTVEYGQLYELRYEVTLKKGVPVKDLIDALREHNGNLEIVVSDAERQG